MRKRVGIDTGRILDISPVTVLHTVQLVALVLVAVFMTGDKPVTALVLAVLILCIQGLIAEIKGTK